MKKINFLQETLGKLQEHSKDPSEVLWVGSKNGEYAISWEEFTQLADKEYEQDHRSQIVAKDLVIVAENWWLERKGYETAEWWIFQEIPSKKAAKPFSALFSYDVGAPGWLTLEQMQDRSI